VFRYCCDRCNQYQRIAHPMYRYQASPGEFSTSTWACHGACSDYTHWMIASADVAKIPRQDIPDSWEGGNEEWFAEIRAVRAQQGEEASGCTLT
jgi:hypothetical protein